MSDAQSIKISVEAGVLEFSAIVTSDVLDLDTIVVHGSIGEASEDILHISRNLYFQKMPKTSKNHRNSTLTPNEIIYI